MTLFLPSLSRQRLYTSVAGHVMSIVGSLAGRPKDGSAIRRLEQAVSRLTGSPHALCMPQARVGIYFVIRALIQPGQKVILSPYTISDVINMVICAGGRPVFADIERETCNISTESVEKLIDKDTGAVMVTHFYGLICDVERIAEICRKKNIPLVEDAAQAFGARIAGKAAGTFGDAGIFSFGLYKSVTSYFGGMIITPDESLRKKIASEIADLPRQPVGALIGKTVSAIVTDTATHPLVFRSLTFWILRYGYLNGIGSINNQLAIDTNPQIKRSIPDSYLCRMSPLQAWLALRGMYPMEEHSRHRIKLAHIYHEGLEKYSDIVLPPLREDGSHQYMYFPVQVPDRHALVRYAMLHGRDIAISHHKNCASMDCFSDFAGDCSNSEATSNSLVYLPTYPGYSEAEARANVRVIGSFFEKQQSCT